VIGFADSSALVKLYVDEAGHEAVRALSILVVGQVARVEVPAAFWRKHRVGELEAADARVLTSAFEADYFGTPDEDPRFVVVAATAAILDHAAGLCARHPLRGFDAIQLASALAVRAVDANVAVMVVHDRSLRAAAAAEGMAVLPATAPGS
jgi:predicted nucleic acid-binding protein